MIRLLLLGLLFFTTLSSNEIPSIIDEIVTTHDPYASEIEEVIGIEPLPKVLYLNFETIPERVIKGEIFFITLKTLSTISNFKDITYDITNAKGLEVLNTIPYRDKIGKYFYDKFYFLVTSSRANIPSFTARLQDDFNTLYKETKLQGKKLKVVTLNPKENYANIVANSFDLVEFKTSSYDDNHNIVVFVAKANNSNIEALKLKNVYKQGIESINKSKFESRITYFVVIDKKIENFSFTYFNLIKNKFILLNIPIIVIPDSVATQTDLKPKDQSHQKLKMLIASIIALVGFIFILWRKKYIYFVLIFIPLFYLVYIGTPSKEVCIKVNSDIHLLPVSNGTIFEKTSSIYHLQKEGGVKDWVKVKLLNEKIGWVKNDDLCSP